jgi:hypothetical protein
LTLSRASAHGRRVTHRIAALLLVLVGCGGTHHEVASSPIEARLAAMPAPPVAWSRPVATLSDEDFTRICPYLIENVGLTCDATACPDGTSVETYVYACEPETSGPAARSLPCAITFGEMLACYLAIREHPCNEGPLGDGLVECEALAQCGLPSPEAP